MRLQDLKKEVNKKHCPALEREIKQRHKKTREQSHGRNIKMDPQKYKTVTLDKVLE
jgi:hypothetical protein